MITKLKKHGDNFTFIIDRSIVDAMGIDERTPLDISTDGSVIIVAPIRDPNRQGQFDEALASSNKRYPNALNRLAE
jgi:antitoxin MazE